MIASTQCLSTKQMRVNRHKILEWRVAEICISYIRDFTTQSKKHVHLYFSAIKETIQFQTRKLGRRHRRQT
jgi:hypothetical protein